MIWSLLFPVFLAIGLKCGCYERLRVVEQANELNSQGRVCWGLFKGMRLVYPRSSHEGLVYSIKQEVSEYLNVAVVVCGCGPTTRACSSLALRRLTLPFPTRCRNMYQNARSQEKEVWNQEARHSSKLGSARLWAVENASECYCCLRILLDYFELNQHCWVLILHSLL